jgi:large subunit ribosomal protein L16
MLQPKRVRWRKPHIPKVKGLANRGNRVSFGEFGLQALETGWLTARQIEAARITMTRHMKRGGRVWIRVFPYQAKTKKPAETRMGKGKGSPDSWAAPIKSGRMLYEVSGVSREIAEEALRLAGHKLGVRTRFVAKSDLEGQFVRDGEEV